MTTSIELGAYAYLDNLHPQFGSLNGAIPDYVSSEPMS